MSSLVDATPAQNGTTGNWLGHGRRHWLDSGELLRRQGILVEAVGESGTRCYLAEDNRLLATFGFRDEALFETTPLLQDLHQRGYRLGLRSGDHPGAVAEFLKEVPAVWEVALGALAPEEKARYVSCFGDRVAVVGDGLNDTLALSTAAVGLVDL